MNNFHFDLLYSTFYIVTSFLIFFQDALFGRLASESHDVREILFDERDSDRYKDNILKLTIYFEEFNYEDITELPAYEVCTVGRGRNYLTIQHII